LELHKPLFNNISISGYTCIMATVDDKKIIYTMYRVAKKHGTKQVGSRLTDRLAKD